jgi:hypothetical protein
MTESHISATHIQIFDKHWRCKFNLDLGRLLDGEFIIRLFDGAPAPKYGDKCTQNDY